MGVKHYNNAGDSWVCDGCGEEIEEGDRYIEDGEFFFCCDCWKELEIHTEIISNEKERVRE